MSGFVIRITTAQLCVQKMKRCIKLQSRVHTHTHTHTINRKKGEITAAIFFYYFRQITLLEN